MVKPLESCHLSLEVVINAEWFYHLKAKSQQVIVKKQLKDLSLKVHVTTIQPVFVGYVGYTCVHLYNRVKGHKQQSSTIAKHYENMHGTMAQDHLKR